MARIATKLVIILVFISCENKTTDDNTIIVPVHAENVTMVNQMDQGGRKQGLWQELDTVNRRIAKEVYYKDDLLDGSYLVYKKGSSDTLTLGHYKEGKKTGEWKYWDISLNLLDRTELYKNDILMKTTKY